MNNKLLSIAHYAVPFTTGLFLLPISYFAGAVTNVTVKVTVIAPLSCEINGNKPITVDFGNAVETGKVNGTNYLKEVNYDINCKNNTTNALKMKISGQTASFDSKAVNTNNANLGIALYNGNTRIEINEGFNFTWPNKPVLKAVPVKNTSATLKSGGFSGAATMTVDYQ